MRSTHRTRVAIMVLGLMVPPTRAVAQQSETMTAPTFGTVTIYRGANPPQQVVLFISGDGGWNLGVVDMAKRLRDAGALEPLPRPMDRPAL